MEFRIFHAADAREVSALIKRSVKERDNSGYTSEQIDSLAGYYTPENFCKDLEMKVIYVCTDEMRIAGTATLRDDEVMAVFILPEYQRNGIGNKFMDVLEDVAVRKGLYKVWLVAGLSAVNFYEKRGYCFVREKLHPSWGKGIVMEKSLGKRK